MSAEKRSHVQWGRTRIEFGVRRSSRRTTVAVAVQPDEGVLLTAPAGVGMVRLEEVVREKAAWIAERRRRHRQRETTAGARSHVSGESVLYLSRHYRLQLTAMGEPGPAKLVHGHLVVEVLPGLAPADKALAVQRHLIAWYRHHASLRLRQRAEKWAAALDQHPTQVLVPAQAKRWGSCDDNGVIRLNWMIIQAPMRLVDYEVAHEIVHIRHKDHSHRFWSRLGKAMPDHERRRQEFRQLGPRFEWRVAQSVQAAGERSS